VGAVAMFFKSIKARKQINFVRRRQKLGLWIYFAWSQVLDFKIIF
jgi:hypothetical protein